MSSRPATAPASRTMPKPSRYCPRSRSCSTRPRSSSALSSRNAVDLCTPSSAATSVTRASPCAGQDLQHGDRPVDRLHPPLGRAADGALVGRHAQLLIRSWRTDVVAAHERPRRTGRREPMAQQYDFVIVGGGSAGSRAGQPALGRPGHPGAVLEAGRPRLPVGRVHPHAGRADLPDRQPVLRLEVRVRAGAAHERPADLPRPRARCSAARAASTG